MLKRCPYCNSIWVCWNWIQEYNPTHDINSDSWVHECWYCENCNFTEKKVWNGIPYWFLKMFYKQKENRLW